MDVRMPDGTIITNVPDNITQEELLARYSMFSGPTSPSKTTSNPLYGAAGRAAEMSGSGMEAIAEVGSRSAKNLSKIIAPEGETPEQKKIREEAFKFEIADPLFKWAKSLKGFNEKIGYEPSTKLSELADNPLNAVPFIAERVVTSVPDMAAAMINLPGYIGIRTKETLDERMKNDNKTLDDATVGDVVAAASGAIIEGTLERFATGRLLKGVPAAKTKKGRIGKETAIQAGTEGIEEGASYLGETAGTIKGVDRQEMFERMLEGAIVGGGLGAGVQTGKEVFRKKEAPAEEPITEEPVKPQAEVPPPTRREEETRQEILPPEQQGMAAEDLALAAFGEGPAKAIQDIAETTQVAPPPKEIPTVTAEDVQRVLTAPRTEEARAPELEMEAPPEIPETTIPEKQLPSPRDSDMVRAQMDELENEARLIREIELQSKTNSLYNFFRDNKLDVKEVADITPDKTFNFIRKKGGAFVSDFVGTGQMNPWLPPQLQIYGTEDAETLGDKEKEATDYIKEKLNSGNFLTFDTEQELEQINLSLNELENLLVKDLSYEQLIEEANSLAADIAATEGFGPPETVTEEGAAGRPAKRAGEPGAPEGEVDQLIRAAQGERADPRRFEIRKKSAYRSRTTPDIEYQLFRDGKMLQSFARKKDAQQMLDIYTLPQEEVYAKYPELKPSEADLAAKQRLEESERQKRLAAERPELGLAAETREETLARQEREAKERPAREAKEIADRERDLFKLEPSPAAEPAPVQLKLFGGSQELAATPAPTYKVAPTEESKVIEKALAGKDPIQAAKWMADNAPREDYRMIAKRVANRLEMVKKAGVDFEMQITKVGDRVPVRLLYSNGISVADFDRQTGELTKIKVYVNDSSVGDNVGTTYDIVMHELLHAATQGALFVGGRTKRGAGTAAEDLSKRLNDVRNVVVKHYNERAKAFRAGKGELNEFETRIYRGANFLSDADEVLAWSMTSREMQDYLESIPYKNTTAWDYFVDTIRRFLGLPTSKDSALSEVLGLSSEILSLPVVERQAPASTPQGQLQLFNAAQARTNVFGGKPPQPGWGRPDDSKVDDIIFTLQDKMVDTKRVIQEIEKARGKLKDRWNAYLQEELYHGRTAKQTNDFLQEELSPLLKAIQAKGFTLADVEEYLHNRHAEERNIQVAKVNPNMPDGGSEIMTADARKYLAGLSPKQKADLDVLANRVDAITQKTRDILIANGLEDPSTIASWEKAYKNYVPLNRAEDDYELSGIGKGVGQGFSVRGPTSKRAVGSKRQVVDILANIAMQRERAIVRSEKTRVAQAVYGLAVQHPNPQFWLAVDPDAVKDPAATVQDLISMGINPADAANIMAEPTQTYVDPQTGLVTQRINPSLRGAENVLAVRVNGKDKFVFFNTRDERAVRMAQALKNLDADQLSRAMSMVARVTRYFAAINTQYNPIFGAINFLRDYQGAALNLTNTPIAGQTKKVMADTWPALRGIYADLRARRQGKTATNQWSKLWDEFQEEGGQTGFRDQFSRSQERSDALERELKRLTEGKPMKSARAVFDWLSDYNETMENAVRLAAYKTALDKGLTKEQAASVAKNLTVNFNRKGQIARQANALYAFFNASVQGTARMYQTLRGPAGKTIFAGGLALGAAQAFLLAAAGFDEDDPPDFVKERNIIIPTGGGKYVTIPMPLGFNVIPNTSRIMAEWFLSGGKNTSKRIAQMTGAFLEMFNPIGNAGWSFQTFAPTIADPAVALFENKDWTGKAIAKKDISDLDPTPGYTRAKETASWFSKNLAEFLNYATGGTKYRPGVFSPTPDQFDYLIGQVTGGVGREIMKAEQTITSRFTGEELPSYKIPLVGRFYGETKSQAAQRDRFYDNIRLINEHENEIKGRRKNREPVDEYYKANPEARLFGYANGVERQINNLRRRREDMIKRGAPKDEVQAIEKKITEVMTKFNERIKQAKEAKP